uniref:Heterogeneous nuclear ribonucleoprotein A1 n=1 Tax=Rhabditophanes sp. KR3021 TaxID=114890 RepID=A0AC35TVT1_9BILA
MQPTLLTSKTPEAVAIPGHGKEEVVTTTTEVQQIDEVKAEQTNGETPAAQISAEAALETPAPETNGKTPAAEPTVEPTAEPTAEIMIEAVTENGTEEPAAVALEDEAVAPVTEGEEPPADSTPLEEPTEAEQFRKIFIGGLTANTTEEMLKEFFGQWEGNILDCVVMRDPATKRSRGFGFVSFSNQLEVDKAMINRPHNIDGKVVDTKRAVPRDQSKTGEANVSSKRLYVSGIRDTHTEEMLSEYFGKFGAVLKTEIINDKATGKPRGFAFVTFDDYDCVDKCILIKSHMINELRCDVKKAVSKEEMNRSMDNGGMRDRRSGGGGERGGMKRRQNDGPSNIPNKHGRRNGPPSSGRGSQSFNGGRNAGHGGNFRGGNDSYSSGGYGGYQASAPWQNQGSWNNQGGNYGGSGYQQQGSYGGSGGAPASNWADSNWGLQSGGGSGGYAPNPNWNQGGGGGSSNNSWNPSGAAAGNNPSRGANQWGGAPSNNQQQWNSGRGGY